MPYLILSILSLYLSYLSYPGGDSQRHRSPPSRAGHASWMSSRSGKKRAAPDAVISYESLQSEDRFQSYLCPVCMDIQAKPVELPCTHSFCAACLATHFETTGSEDGRACPMCRTKVPPGAVPGPISDRAERQAVRVKCACGKEVPLLDARRHTDVCTALQGLGQSAVNKAVATSASRASAAPAAPNRSTFSCPFCAERHMPRADLLRHLQNEHGDMHGRPGICPVCAAMPWGDSNYVSPRRRSSARPLLLQHRRSRRRCGSLRGLPLAQGCSRRARVPQASRGTVHRPNRRDPSPPFLRRRPQSTAAYADAPPVRLQRDCRLRPARGRCHGGGAAPIAHRQVSVGDCACANGFGKQHLQRRADLCAETLCVGVRRIVHGPRCHSGTGHGSRRVRGSRFVLRLIVHGTSTLVP